MIQSLSDDTKATLREIPDFNSSLEATAWLEWTELSLERLALEKGLYRELRRMRKMDELFRVFTAASLVFTLLFQIFSWLAAPRLTRFFRFAPQICPLLVGCSYLFYRYEKARIPGIEEELDQIEPRLHAFARLSQNQIPRIEKILQNQLPKPTAALEDLQRLKEALIQERIISARGCEASLALYSPLPNGEGSEDSSH